MSRKHRRGAEFTGPPRGGVWEPPSRGARVLRCPARHTPAALAPWLAPTPPERREPHMPGSSMPKGKRAAATQEAEDASTLDTVAAGGPSQPAEEKPAKQAKRARKPERSGANQPYENGVLRELVRPSHQRGHDLAIERRGRWQPARHMWSYPTPPMRIPAPPLLRPTPHTAHPTPHCRCWRTS